MRHYCCRLQRSASEAIVRIADSGEGIVPEFLAHVFDMFRQQEERTRRKHSGLGIGLALSSASSNCIAATSPLRALGQGRGIK